MLITTTVISVISVTIITMITTATAIITVTVISSFQLASNSGCSLRKDREKNLAGGLNDVEDSHLRG